MSCIFSQVKLSCFENIPIMYFQTCLRNKPSNSVMGTSSRKSILWSRRRCFYLYTISSYGEKLQLDSVNEKHAGGQQSIWDIINVPRKMLFPQIQYANVYRYTVTRRDALHHEMLMTSSTMTDTFYVMISNHLKGVAKRTDCDYFFSHAYCYTIDEL